MDETKYEKIDGGFIEAITLMRQGKIVTDYHGVDYLIRADEKLYFLNNGVQTISRADYNGLVVANWYIKKPFDVRQAMRDKPNEWVGAVIKSDSKLYKVGFDTDYFLPVQAPFNDTGDPMFIRYDRATKASLDNCIAIEDVPEEVTR